jgi:hypothetical protein
MRVFLVAVPLGGVFIGTLVVDNLRDALRVFVLAQAAVICGLYLQVLVNVAGRVMERSSDRLTNEIRRGHMCTLLAIFVLLSEEIWRVVRAPRGGPLQLANAAAAARAVAAAARLVVDGAPALAYRCFAAGTQADASRGGSQARTATGRAAERLAALE